MGVQGKSFAGRGRGANGTSQLVGHKDGRGDSSESNAQGFHRLTEEQREELREIFRLFDMEGH
eukprot:9648793-Prorocentrum_lima.AAC.1